MQQFFFLIIAILYVRHVNVSYVILTSFLSYHYASPEKTQEKKIILLIIVCKTIINQSKSDFLRAAKQCSKFSIRIAISTVSRVPMCIDHA